MDITLNSGTQKFKIEHLYKDMEGKRQTFLERSRDFSSYTLPHLLPRTLEHGGDLGSGANQYGWENIGAAAVNHLSNKLTNTLFPHQHDFFSLEFTTEAEQALASAGIEKTKLNLSLVEAVRRAKDIDKEMEGRIAMYQAMEHLIVSGNILIAEIGDKVKAIPLDRYVVKRDKSDNVLCVIIEETQSLSSFPPAIQAMLKVHKVSNADTKGKDDVRSYLKYTREGDMYKVEQEVEGIPVDVPKKVSVKDTVLYALRWKANYGEAYGRGLVENHAGDFFVIKFLSEAIGKGMAMMADVKYLIKPGSMIDLDHFIKSPTGEAMFGNPDDVTVIQLEKYADFTPISEVLNEYKRRIGHAFLMNSAIRRDAERVTTVELRMDAAELEGAFGGVYTMLDAHLQTPYAQYLLGKVNLDIESNIKPVIRTGMDALGRLGDVGKISQFSELMQLPQTWPQQVQANIDWNIYASEIATALNMQAKWLKQPEQVQADAKAQQRGEMTNMVAEQAAKGMASAMPDMINNNTEE